MKNEEVVQIHLDDIIPNRFQPREYFDEQGLKELAVSIREHGVIQPIIVRQIGDKYEIIAGERRYKASSMIGNTNIPAIIKNLDDKEASKVALIENLQRRDLTPIEEARTYQKILDIDEMTQEQLAKTMGKSQSSVANKLRLLTLPEEVQQALLQQKISERHARSLLNLEDSNKQLNLLYEIMEKRLPVREVEKKIKLMNESNTPERVEEGNSMQEPRMPEETIQQASPSPSIEAQMEKKINIEPEKIEVMADPMSEAVQERPMGGGDIEANPDIQAIGETDSFIPTEAVDQTIVDVDKIKSEAMDINPVQTKAGLNFDDLLKGEGITPLAAEEKPQEPTKFIPDLGINNIDNTNNMDQTIGGGIGSGFGGMPSFDTSPVEPSNQGLGGIIQEEQQFGGGIQSLDNQVTEEKPQEQYADLAPMGMGGPMNIEANLNPEPITESASPEPMITEPQNMGGPDMMSQAPQNMPGSDTTPQAPQSGQNFSNTEEIRFAGVAITNIANDLKSKGFNVNVVEKNENGKVEIILQINN